MTTVVVGANGFIGSAVARRLVKAGENHLIGFVRSVPEHGRISGLTYETGDITDLRSVVRAVSGADVVICCVSYVGNDAERCIEVNDLGVGHVASAASEVGAKRLIHVSTASVYGTGPFRDLPVDGAPLNPYSPASRTRVISEEHIRSAGGKVVRPHLVYGPGDRWFGPELTSIIDKLGATIEDGAALLSTIHVDRLAAGVVALVKGDDFIDGSVEHLNDPEPESVKNILAREYARTGRQAPMLSIDRPTALDRARSSGISRRHIDMISLDHWFRAGSS